MRRLRALLFGLPVPPVIRLEVVPQWDGLLASAVNRTGLGLDWSHLLRQDHTRLLTVGHTGLRRCHARLHHRPGRWLDRSTLG